MPYFQSHSGKVYYEDIGKGNSIIFIHGRTLDSRMWQPQIELLKTNYRCITYDLNGFGKSEIPKDGYDPVLTLKELIEHLNLTKVTIIALSLGTHIAINFAIEYQQYINKLVLMSCTIPGTKFSKKFNDDWTEVENTGKQGDFDLAKKLWINCKAFSQLEKNNPNNYKLFCNIIDSYNCWDIFRPPKKKSRPDAINRLSEIIVPTLIISGEKDYKDFIKNGELLRKKLPKSEITTISNATHMVNLEFPSTVNKLISDFLES